MTFCFPGHFCTDLSDHVGNDSPGAGLRLTPLSGQRSPHSFRREEKNALSSSVVDSSESTTEEDNTFFSSGWNV